MKPQFLLLCLFLLGKCLIAQGDELQTLLTDIDGSLVEIVDKKTTITQSLLVEAAHPYRVTFEVKENDGRGSENTSYEFNLAFFEERVVKWASNRREMYVEIDAADDQIKVYKDGEFSKYTDELKVLCDNIDLARKLEEQLKKAIVLAKQLWEKEGVVPTTYDALKPFIVDLLGEEVAFDDESYVQTLEAKADSKTRFSLRQRKVSDKGTEESPLYIFDFADINAGGLDIEVKGNEIYVEVPCVDKKDFIETLEDGETDFASALKIYVNSFEDAQILSDALRKFTDLCVKIEEGNQPNFATGEEALKYLNSLIKDFKFNEESISQQADCQCFFEIDVTVTEADKQEQQRLIVDLSDLSANNIEIKVASKGISVVLPVRDKQNFIMVYENGEQENYDDELAIRVPDVPTAKAMRYAFSKAIGTCKDGITVQDFDWLSKEAEMAYTDGETSAKLSLPESGNNCKWAYTITEEGEKGQKIERYEFNLSDLNEKEVALATKGKTAFVIASTKFKERVISLYNEDGEAEYENEVSFTVADIRSGKTFIGTLMRMIEGCVE